MLVTWRVPGEWSSSLLRVGHRCWGDTAGLCLLVVVVCRGGPPLLGDMARGRVGQGSPLLGRRCRAMAGVVLSVVVLVGVSGGPPLLGDVAGWC